MAICGSAEPGRRRTKGNPPDQSTDDQVRVFTLMSSSKCTSRDLRPAKAVAASEETNLADQSAT
jgi:hypothetical protein